MLTHDLNVESQGRPIEEQKSLLERCIRLWLGIVGQRGVSQGQDSGIKFFEQDLSDPVITSHWKTVFIFYCPVCFAGEEMNDSLIHLLPLTERIFGMLNVNAICRDLYTIYRVLCIVYKVFSVSCTIFNILSISSYRHI